MRTPASPEVIAGSRGSDMSFTVPFVLNYVLLCRVDEEGESEPNSQQPNLLRFNVVVVVSQYIKYSHRKASFNFRSGYSYSNRAETIMYAFCLLGGGGGSAIIRTTTTIVVLGHRSGQGGQHFVNVP
jgi:hypothetical protein